MSKNKSFSPWRMWSSYFWAFLFTTMYITLVITSNIAFGVLDDSRSTCLGTCSGLPQEQIEICNNQCNEIIDSTAENNRIFKFLDIFKQIPTPDIMRFTPLVIMWIMILFVTGFLFGWGIGSLKRVIEK